MKRIFLFIAVAGACGGDRNPENSFTCGLAIVAAGGHVIEQFQIGTTVLDGPPSGLDGVVPARVVGYGTGRALAARDTESEFLVVGFEGEGFPTRPGFAVALVDDSSEVFRGILVFDSDGPADYPQFGTISSAASTLPLYGMRVSWGSVSEERCPLFAEVSDSTP